MKLSAPASDEPLLTTNLLPAGTVKDFRYVKTFEAQGVEFAHKIAFIAKFGGRVRLRSVRLEKYV